VGTNPPRFCCKFRCTPTSEQHVREVGGLAVKPNSAPGAGTARRGVGSCAFRHSFIGGQLTSMPSSPGLECPARVLWTTLLRFMPSGAIPPPRGQEEGLSVTSLRVWRAHHRQPNAAPCRDRTGGRAGGATGGAVWRGAYIEGVVRDGGDPVRRRVGSRDCGGVVCGDWVCGHRVCGRWAARRGEAAVGGVEAGGMTAEIPHFIFRSEPRHLRPRPAKKKAPARL